MMFSMNIDEQHYIMINLISERTGAPIEDILDEIVEKAMLEEYSGSFVEDVKNGVYSRSDYEDEYGRLY